MSWGKWQERTRALAGWIETRLGTLGGWTADRWPIVVVALLAVTAVIGRVDGALTSRHRLDAVSGGMGDVTSPMRAATPQIAQEVVAGWDEGVRPILAAYLALDLALMILVVLTLLLVRAKVEQYVRVAATVGETTTLQRRYRRAALSALRWSALAVAAYWVADLVETIVAYASSVDGSLGEGVARSIGIAAMVKWSALALAVLPMALVGVGSLAGLRRRAFAGVVALRGQVIVVALLVALFLALQGDIGRQIDDVVLFAAQSPTKVVLATLVLILLSLAMLLGGRASLAAYRSAPEVRALQPRHLVATGAVCGGLIVLVVLGTLLLGRLGWETAQPSLLVLLGVPGVLVLVWVLLSIPDHVRGFTRRGDPSHGVSSTAWVRPLALAPVLILWLALLRAGTQLIFDGAWSWLLFAWTAGLLLVLCVLFYLYRRVDLSRDSDPSVYETFTWLAGSVAALSGMAFVRPAAWMAIGSVGVLLLLSLVISCGLTGLTLLGDRLAPRGALAITGIRRLPVISGLLAWTVLASIVDTNGNYYDAPLQVGAESAAPVPADQALMIWLAVDDQGHNRSTETGPPPDRSLVFVASSGGGIRAAYWTEIVWDCAFADRCIEPGGARDRGREVFFASGVSGGAVGLSLALVDRRNAGAQDRFDNDFLAPALAALVARDLPNSLLRLPLPGHDRAATLASAFEGVEGGLEAPFSRRTGLTPFLALSGTSVEDGCRFTLSTVQQAGPRTRCEGTVSDFPDGAPGASPVRQGQDFLCDSSGRHGDVTLGTAAFLSARFPYVSPTAGLHSCDEPRTTYVLDGGMFDNSGGSSVSNVLDALGPALYAVNRHEGRAAGTWSGCVIPRLLVIDNTFASTAALTPARRPLQSLGPGLAIDSFYGNRSDRELVAAAQAVRDAAERARYLCRSRDTLPDVEVIHPVAVPGAAAPLGWTLARSTRATMDEQLPVPEKCHEVKPNDQELPSADAVSASARGLSAHRIRMCAAIQTVHAWLDVASP